MEIMFNNQEIPYLLGLISNDKNIDDLVFSINNKKLFFKKLVSKNIMGIFHLNNDLKIANYLYKELNVTYLKNKKKEEMSKSELVILSLLAYFTNYNFIYLKNYLSILDTKMVKQVLTLASKLKIHLIIEDNLDFLFFFLNDFIFIDLDKSYLKEKDYFLKLNNYRNLPKIVQLIKLSKEKGIELSLTSNVLDLIKDIYKHVKKN